MKYLISLLIGYLLGSISPSALISRIKKTDLRKSGTGNLGATNTALTFGKKCGAMVLVFDIFKGALSVILAKLIFNEISSVAGMVAGCGAVLGHMFPFYMRFRGGKGLAAYGGMILALDPVVFLTLLGIGSLAMAIFRCGIALTVAAATLFPIFTAITSREDPSALILIALSAAISAVLLLRHMGNLTRAVKGQDLSPSRFFEKVFREKQDKTVKK